jgi:hypothetical protein
MKIKRVAGGLLMLGVIAAAATAFVWSEGGSVPAWYPQAERPAEPARPQLPGDAEGADALLRRLQRDGSITMDGDDLARLATEGLAESGDGREFLRVSRGLQGRVGDGEIEVGGVFDLSAIDESALSPDTRDGLVRLRQTVPFLVTGERYLGVRGAPHVAEGALEFADGATLRVGDVGIPLALIGWLGSDTDAARLHLPGLRATSVRIIGERVTVEAEPRTP